MRKFKSISAFLRFILLMPAFLLFGVGADGDGAGAGQDGAKGAGDDGKGDDAGKGDSGANKPDKTFSQADIDKAVSDRLKRENAKFQKQLDDLKKQMSGDGGDATGKPAGADAGTGAGAGESEMKAQALLATANQRVVQATAVTEAVKLGVDPKYTQDLVRLADLTKVEVAEDGSVDSAAIAKELEAVLKRLPMFKTTTDNGSGFRVGGDGSGQQNKENAWGKNATQATTPAKPWNRQNRM